MRCSLTLSIETKKPTRFNRGSITKEDEHNYYGNWVAGLGFFNVRFPKVTTRALTDEEIEHYNRKALYLGHLHTGPREKIGHLTINP